MAENDPSGKGQQAGGCGVVFSEPKAAAHGISGLWRCPYFQQSGRECNLALWGRMFYDSVKGPESSAIVCTRWWKQPEPTVLIPMNTCCWY